MGEVVFLNGKFLPRQEARVSVLTPGFLSGWGLFETMRSYNGKIVYFAEHLKRIERSSKIVAIRAPFSIPRIKGIIKKAVKICGFQDAYIRLTFWKKELGADVLLVVKKYNPYPAQKYKTGFRAIASPLRQPEGWPLAGLKSTSRLLYQLSLRQAALRGFDEALILNHRGWLTEGSISNVFLVKDGAVFTPAPECGCLEGITRRVIFDLAQRRNIKIYEGKFSLKDLYEADEAFLTNSLMGVMPLASVENHTIKKGISGKMTTYFIKRYNSLLKHGT